MRPTAVKHWIYWALFGAVFWAVALSAIAQHVPSATSTGSEVTIDADIAWFDATSPPASATLLEGTPLSGGYVYASSDGASPIKVEVPAGTYTVYAMGFPADRRNPQREFRTLSVEVTVSRQDLINLAYKRLFEARDSFVLATGDIVALVPTPEEVGTALANFTSNP